MYRLNSLLVFISFVLVTLFFSSCNNDLELIGDKKEVPIVYGAISVSDPFVFIRLERAFGDNVIAPAEIAKNPDSLYFPSAVVNISLPAESFSIDLVRVDATSLGFPRDTGIFASNPNYIYMADKNLFVFKPGAEYILTITIGDKVYTAKTVLINQIEILLPKANSPLIWNPKLDEVITQAPLFSFDGVGNVESADPSIVSLYIRFNYKERDVAVSQDYLDKSLMITVAESVIPADNRFRYSINKIYQSIGDGLVKSSTIDRYFTTLDFVVVTGGKEFLDYNEALAANAGITGTQDFPIFTNIEGGYGIFSSKNSQTFPGYTLSDLSLDSLAIGRFTRELNFRE